MDSSVRKWTVYSPPTTFMMNTTVISFNTYSRNELFASPNRQ